MAEQASQKRLKSRVGKTPSVQPAPESDVRQQLARLVHAIPPGRVVAYGKLGSFCTPPLSGYFCGRMLGSMGADLPWWRVVARDGSLPVSRRNPELSLAQREQLESEGVSFNAEGKIEAAYFVTSEDELDGDGADAAAYGAAG